MKWISFDARTGVEGIRVILLRFRTPGGKWGALVNVIACAGIILFSLHFASGSGSVGFGVVVIGVILEVIFIRIFISEWWPQP
jgi:hypothetical protein